MVAAAGGRPAHPDVFIDAGAGNGAVTRAFVNSFDRTIAIEPNPLSSINSSRSFPQVGGDRGANPEGEAGRPREILSSVHTSSITFHRTSGWRTLSA